MPVSKSRPIYRMRLVVTTCNAQLISNCVNAKVAPISIKEVNKMRLSLQVGPTSCYYKLHSVNWPLTNYYLVWLSLLKSPALVNDYWTVINTAVTEGSKHFLLRRGGGGGGGGDNVYPYQMGVCHFDQKSSTQKSENLISNIDTQKFGNLLKIDTQKSGNPKL